MKRWILESFFADDLEAATRAGSMDAFAKAHADIRETMADDLERRAEELMHDKLVNLLTVVDDRAVVTFDKRVGAVFIGGERAEPARLQALKSEAQLVLTSEIWKIIFESPKELAQRAMFLAGESLDDLKKGRAILYTLDTQKKILDTFAAYQQPPKT